MASSSRLTLYVLDPIGLCDRFLQLHLGLPSNDFGWISYELGHPSRNGYIPGWKMMLLHKVVKGTWWGWRTICSLLFHPGHYANEKHGVRF